MSLRRNLCPTCKQEHYFRKEDGICGRCKDLIEEALETRRLSGKEKNCR